MKKAIISVIYICITLNVLAQTNFEPIKITLNDGTQIEGLKKEEISIYYSPTIKVYNKLKNLKFYTPDEYKSFSFRDIVYFSDGQNIYKLHSKGEKVNLYIQHQYKVADYGTSNTLEQKVFFVKKKADTAYLKCDIEKFHETFSEYFKENKALSDAILSNKYTEDDIETIVQIFNKQE